MSESLPVPPPVPQPKKRADAGKKRGSYKKRENKAVENKAVENNSGGAGAVEYSTPATPIKSTVTKESFTFAQSPNAGTAKLDLSNLNAKPDTEQTEQSLEEDIRPLIEMGGTMFNGIFDEKSGESVKPEWTKQHTEIWVKSTSAILAKYGTGGLEKFTPELMLLVAVVQTVVLGIQASAYIKSKQAPKGVVQYQAGTPQPMGAPVIVDKKKEAWLDKLAAERMSEIAKSVGQ